MNYIKKVTNGGAYLKVHPIKGTRVINDVAYDEAKLEVGNLWANQSKGNLCDEWRVGAIWGQNASIDHLKLTLYKYHLGWICYVYSNNERPVNQKYTIICGKMKERFNNQKI